MTSPLPPIQVRVGFGNGPLDDHTAWAVGTTVAHNQWTDITANVASITFNRGRQHELNRFAAGTCTIILNNQTGTFNSWDLSSPYAGLMLPMKKLQVMTVLGGNHYLYTGHIIAWKTSWPDSVSQWAQIDVVDGFRFLNQAFLSSTAYPDAVAAGGATHYWRCNDAPGSSTMADTGTSPVAATLSAGGHNVALPILSASSPLLVTPQSGSVAMGSYNAYNGTSGGSQNWINVNGAAPTGPFTFEGWFQVPSGSIAPVIWADNAGSATNSMQLSVQNVTGGLLLYCTNNAGAAVYISSGVAVLDGAWHYVRCGYSSGAGGFIFLSVDGAAQTNNPSGVFVLTASPANGMQLGASDTGGNLSPGGVNLAELAIYPTATITDKYALAFAFPQQRTGARINAIANAVGWPTGLRSIDPGIQSCQRNSLNLVAVTALPFAQLVEQTEGGAVFINAFGNLRFDSRDSIAGANTAYGTIQATFGDALTDIPFQPGPELALDDQDIINQAIITRQGGLPQRYDDLASQNPSTGYGLKSSSESGLLFLTDAASLAKATWEVNKLSQPIDRLRSIHINLIDVLAAPTLATQVLSLDLLYRVKVERVSAGFTQTALIEGISMTITANSWDITLALSPSDTYPTWSWGGAL